MHTLDQHRTGLRIPMGAHTGPASYWDEALLMDILSCLSYLAVVIMKERIEEEEM